MKTNEGIEAAIREELRWEPLLHADPIMVSVFSGEVILSGRVDGYRKKFIAQVAAGRVKGGGTIVNQIQVVISPKDKRNDKVIASDVVDTLAWHNSIPANSIRVQVAGGCVTLTGEVPFAYQAETALHAIMHLKGITDINDRIVISPVSVSLEKNTGR